MICISPIPRFLPELTGKRMAKKNKKQKTPNKQTNKQKLLKDNIYKQICQRF